MTAVGERSSSGQRQIPQSISLGLGSGTMLQALNSSMIAVAIVGIAAHFGSGAGTSWVISALYIATAVTAPSAGKLGTLFGPRRVYLTGLALITAGSVLGALAPTLGWLVVARILQGIGTGSQYPTAMTIIRTIADRRGAAPRSAIAVLAMCSQTVVALGPTIGGLLVGTFGWQSIMWVNLPLVLVTLVWVVRVVPRDTVTPPSDRRAVLDSLDVPGLAGFLGTIAATMFFLLSLRSEPRWWLLPVACALGCWFTWWERRAPTPFLDVRTIARNRALSMTLGRTLATYTAFYCVFFGLPQWLQESRGFSAMTAGLLMLPVAGIGIVSTMAASRTYAGRGPRRTLFIGTLGLAVGGVLLTTVEGGTTPIVVLLAVACVLGVPNGFNNMGNQNLINTVTDAQQVGTAIGMYRTVQYIGANLSAVIIELTMQGSVDDAGLHRTGLAITVIGAALLAGVVCSRTLRQQRATTANRGTAAVRAVDLAQKAR